MKTIQPTKEQLVIELAKVKDTIARYETSDENRRIEFAKAFLWFKKNNSYFNNEEFITPTWTQIFIKIGRLLAGNDFTDFEGNISELECQVKDLKEKIAKIDIVK